MLQSTEQLTQLISYGVLGWTSEQATIDRSNVEKSRTFVTTLLPLKSGS